MYVIVKLFEWWLMPSFDVDFIIRSQDEIDLNGIPQTAEVQYTYEADIIAGDEAELELRYTPRYIGPHVLRTTVGFANATGNSDGPVIKGQAELLFIVDRHEKGLARDVGIDRHGNLKIAYDQSKFMPLYNRKSQIRSLSKLFCRKIPWHEFKNRHLLGEFLHNPVTVTILDPGTYTLFTRITTEIGRIEERLTVNAIPNE